MLPHEQICSIYDNLIKHICSVIPNFRICDKSSIYMKILSKIYPPSKKCVITSYPRIYFSSLPYDANGTEDYNKAVMIQIICHEFVHLYDSKRLKCMFKIAYLFPQILASLPLLSFFNIWWLCALIFILPMPAPFRAYFEYRAYVTSMAINWWLFEETPNIEQYADYFSSWTYYKMWPFRKMMKKYFTNAYVDIMNGKFDDDTQKLYNICHNMKK